MRSTFNFYLKQRPSSGERTNRGKIKSSPVCQILFLGGKKNKKKGFQVHMSQNTQNYAKTANKKAEKK